MNEELQDQYILIFNDMAKSYAASIAEGETELNRQQAEELQRFCSMAMEGNGIDAYIQAAQDKFSMAILCFTFKAFGNINQRLQRIEEKLSE
jgi:hypothetical protein